MKKDFVQVHINITKSLHKELKWFVLKQNTTLKSLVIKALQEHIERNNPVPKPEELNKEE